MAKRKQRVEEETRELTRKEVRLRARDRERNRRLYLGTGIAIGLALLVIIVGLVMEFLIKPNSTLAKVGDDKIITKEFWKRTKLEQSQMENQLTRYQQLEQQFGGQGFFQQQISQLQSTLSSPFALGTQVLNDMINEKIVAQQAKARSISVTDEEVDKALRDEIANGRGAVTAPQATATAAAAITATAEAAATASVMPTQAVTGTKPVSGAIGITTSKPVTTTKVLTASKPVTPSKAVTTSQVVTANKAVAASKPVTTTKTVTPTKVVTAATKAAAPVVNATKPVTPTKVAAVSKTAAVTATKAVTTTKVATVTKAVTTTQPVTTSKAVTATQPVTSSKAVTSAQPATANTAVTKTNPLTVTTPLTLTPAPTPTPEPLPTRAILTDTGYTEGLNTLTENLKTVAGMSIAEYREVIRSRLLSDKLSKVIGEEKVPPTEEQVHARHILVSVITPTPPPAATATPLPAGAPTPVPPPAPRTEQQAMAEAVQLREQIVKGAKFEDIAAKYSDDKSNAEKGGDLGWFGKGSMVKSFEDAAFSLKVGDLSQPITTTYGVHLIQVLEKDPQHKLDEQTLTQKRNQAYQTWLQEQISAAKIERPTDLAGSLPSDLKPFVPTQ